jgi:hypothetical protein
MTLGLFPRADIDVVEALEVVRQELDRHDQNRPPPDAAICGMRSAKSGLIASQGCRPRMVALNGSDSETRSTSFRR